MTSPVRGIEDRAFKLACATVRFCDEHASSGGVKARILIQLVDSATSIGANLEEAAGGQSKADFIAKACVARKEAREARYWLRVAGDRVRHCPKGQIEPESRVVSMQPQ
jgi:four helix bundle protein